MDPVVVLDSAVLADADSDWNDLRDIAGALRIYDRTPAELVVERCAGAELVLTSKSPIRDAGMNQLPRLRYIGVIATGYDIVDVAAATRRGIVVTNVPYYGSESVAQFVFALLFELANRVGFHHSAVHDGRWSTHTDWSMRLTPLVELAGKTIGIVGYGRIGSRVGRIAEALGMMAIVHDQRTDLAVTLAPLEDLLSTADVVTLHCPLTPETNGLMNRDRLALMKRSAFLINTARGPLVVPEHLAEALNSGRLAGGALDVLWPEPPPPDHPLLTAKNCVVTPHIAWATREARARLLHAAFENVRAYLSGSPVNTVSG
jgi:glycerate dehydrogenase